MRKINFAFGVHLHQPLGNFDHVFEYAYKSSYLPFIETMERFPSVKVAVHVTGTLWEWLESHHPEFFGLLKKLCERGQVEILGGGFYEPILSVIPPWDQQEQIKLMNQRVKKRFKKEPTGMWVAERIWEPQLASIIARGGIKYVVLDDYHFNAAGLPTSDLLGHFVTEDAGEELAVFPISERLRYQIPFAQPNEPIEFMEKMASSEEPRLIMMFDDCEKFGVWPGTHKWVFTERWLEKFLTMVSEADFIETVTPSEYMESHEPRGRVYLPTCSYSEMGEWTLPMEPALIYEELVSRLKNENSLDRYRPFVRGGFWRGFLAKYAESNYMHKRMWHVSKQVHSIKGKKGAKEASADVMRAQCNCAYWHGVFGGLYLPHLRFAIYRKLIEAEAAVQNAQHGDEDWVSLAKDDIDSDGHEEVMVENRNLACVFSPVGGAMAELDCRRSFTNVTDTLSRHKEAYHASLGKASDASSSSEHASIHDRQREVSERILKNLHYDWHPKMSFLDHFLPLGTDLACIRDSRYRDLGDFVKTSFEVDTTCSDRTAIVRFKRKGALYPGHIPQPLKLGKRFAIERTGSKINCDYRIDYEGQESVEAIFAVEFSFACYGEGDDCQFTDDGNNWQMLGETARLKGAKAVRLSDPYRGFSILLSFDVEADIFRFPLQTVSQSESGFELIKQATTVLVQWPLKFPEDGKVERRIELELKAAPEG
ncbi:MAG: DUF1926 domain-containing protein [Candidatus Coatesbacteria bacterium]|nr:DUF1926 domain-containing protein [Candidatus Coatesbacteria bacterium]